MKVRKYKYCTVDHVFNHGRLPYLQKNSKPDIKNKIILPKLHLKEDLLQKQCCGSGIRDPVPF
jgi:hypothetical protein